MKRGLAVHEIALHVAAVDLYFFDIAGVDFGQKFTEIQRSVVLGVTLFDHGPKQHGHADQNYPEYDCFYV
jgi:hypothetical protein